MLFLSVRYPININELLPYPRRIFLFWHEVCVFVSYGYNRIPVEAGCSYPLFHALPVLHSQEKPVMNAIAIRRWLTAFLCCFYISLLLASPSSAQPFFTNVTDEIGVDPFEQRSTAWGDYDNDGLPDIFMSQHFAWGSRLLLLRGEGDGYFLDRTEDILTDIPSQKKGGGAGFADYDNDGDLDLFVPVGAYYSEDASINMLLRNDRGVFRDVALEAGLVDASPTDNALWLDYDRDGFLDILTGNVWAEQGAPSEPGRNKLYRNRGDGTFVDVTHAAGLDIQFDQWGGSGGGMAAADFDGDGWIDLYLGAEQDRNRLFFNDGQGRFQDATTEETGDTGASAFSAVGDYDNDGDLDICHFSGITNISGRSFFLLNLGNRQFLDVTEAIGLSSILGSLGGDSADVDNDGDLDLIESGNPFLFLNNGDGTFTDRSDWFGTPSDLGFFPNSFGDFNLDGFLDGVGFTSLFRHNGNDHHWLRVTLVGTESGRDGLGARLIATSGSLQQLREISGGVGFGHSERVAHFGLEERTQVDRLEIRWPSGQVDVLTDIPADQKIRVIEGREGYHVVQPSVWEETPPDTVLLNPRVTLALAVRPALFEPDAAVTKVTADLTRFGGLEETPLEDRGDGTYELRSSLLIEGVSGVHPLSVMIDQHTVLGPYWIKLSRDIAVFPDRDVRILDEKLDDGWQVEESVSVEPVDFEQNAIVYQGDFASAFKVQPESRNRGWGVRLLPDAPIDAVGFSSVRFAFHPGNAKGEYGDVLNFTLNDQLSIQLPAAGYVDMEKKSWQIVEVPLAEFPLNGPIEEIRISGNLEGIFYLDDMRLVAATPPPSNTAVLEEHSPSLPNAFTLSQNYPNPFNNSTVIRFALPTTADVQLSIFNLTGQQVATLTDGIRAAGTYTLRWDGRDDDDQPLASGVYLYRLRTGDGLQQETRKLLLIR